MPEAIGRYYASRFDVSRPDEKPTRIEVVLIATFVDKLIHRVWETTWPSWRTVEAFADY